MSDDLTFRLYTEDDIPAMLDLWASAGTWGSLTESEWRKWYIDTPHGDCIISIAIDGEGKIHGQEVFTPSRAVVGDREVSAIRLSAPIVGDRLRQSPLLATRHPVWGMFKAGIDAARDDGYELLYGLPHRAWLMVFRLGRLIGMPKAPMGQFPCVTLPLRGEEPASIAAENTNGATIVEDFGDGYEELWEAARRDFPVEVGVVRSRQWVKFRSGDHLKVEVRDDQTNELMSYVAFSTEGLLYDMLGRDDRSLKTAITTAYRYMREMTPEPGKKKPKTLRALRVPTIGHVLDDLGFEPIDFKFGFACYPLDEAIDRANLVGDKWYVTPGD